MSQTPEYRLQVLLELRERKKDDAERALGAAIAARQVELDKQRAMEAELARLAAKREQKKRDYAEKAMRGVMSARDVVGANVFLEHLEEQERAQKNAVEAQRAVVAQRAREVETARQELVVATQELEALEKHKEKLADGWKKQQAAKEEQAMDELAQQIFLKGEPW